MAGKQCFLVCPPSGNMARKQCFLVCPPFGNMARKQFVVCSPFGNLTVRNIVSWFCHCLKAWLDFQVCSINLRCAEMQSLLYNNIHMVLREMDIRRCGFVYLVS